MPDGRQNTHLVDCIILFFVREVLQSHNFERIHLPVGDPFDFVDLAVGSVTQVRDHFELFQARRLFFALCLELGTFVVLLLFDLRRVLSLLGFFASLGVLTFYGRVAPPLFMFGALVPLLVVLDGLSRGAIRSVQRRL